MDLTWRISWRKISNLCSVMLTVRFGSSRRSETRPFSRHQSVGVVFETRNVSRANVSRSASLASRYGRRIAYVRSD